jgi:hypothetical protein
METQAKEEPMNTILLRIRSRWQVSGLLLFLYTLGFAAGFPFILTVHRYASAANAWMDGLQGFMLGVAALVLGSFLAGSTGLGTPTLEDWIAKRRPRIPLDTVVSLSIVAVIAGSLILVLVRLLVVVIGVMVGGDVSAAASASTNPVGDYPELWKWLLVSFHAGVTEEILFRFGLMNLLVWLGRRLGRSPGTTAIWTANLIAAIVFGALHLVGILPVPDIPLVQASVVVQNTMVGLVFGWFYWKLGLESAMLTHMLLDVFFYVIMIPILMTGQWVVILAWLVVTVVVLTAAIGRISKSSLRRILQRDGGGGPHES